MAIMPRTYRADKNDPYGAERDRNAWADYRNDHQRFTPPTRTPCANPGCATLTETTYCSGDCRHEAEAWHHTSQQAWELHMAKLGCAPTPHFVVTQETGTTIALGDCQLSDEQYIVDQDAGGFVALVCSPALPKSQAVEEALEQLRELKKARLAREEDL